MNIHPNTSDAYRLLHNGTLALGRAERQGIRVNVEYLKTEKVRLSREIANMESDFRESKFFHQWDKSTKSDINTNSSVQLRNFLYKVKKLKPPKLTDTGQGSTDEEALQKLNIPELKDLIRIRKLKKIRDTYLDGYLREQVNGYIHPFFNLNLVKTFRSSSDSPNFQNIPKRDKEAMNIVRRALYPRPGHQLLEVDYSGLEVRIAACYHKDEKMLAYIKNPKSDMHRDMMEEIFKIKYDGTNPQHGYLRSAAKNGFVFPQFYGDYFVNNARDMACKWGELPNGRWSDGDGIELAQSTLGTHLRKQGFASIKSFEKHIEQIEYEFWENRFPQYARWKKRWWTLYKRKGYIDMLTGFRCSGVMSRNDATNYAIQGSAFHCLLWSLNELDRTLVDRSFRTKIIGQVHDSIVFDLYPPERETIAKLVREVTTQELSKAWPWIIVPLEVDADICPVDGSWAEKEKYNLIA